MHLRERVRRSAGRVRPSRDQRQRPAARADRPLPRRVEPGGVPRPFRGVRAARRGRGATPADLGLLPRTAYSRRPLYDSAGRLGRRPPATDRAAATQARPSLRDVAAVVLSLASGSRYRRLLSPSTMWAVSSTGPSEPKNSFPSCDAWSDQPYRSVSSSCARRSSCRSGSDSAASFGARRRLRNGHMLSVSTDEGGRIRKGWRENTRWTVPRQPVAHRLGWPNPSRLPVG